LKIDLANEIVRLTLYPSQAQRFRPLLEDALNRTGGISGILCTINKFQDLSEGPPILGIAGRATGWSGDPQNPATDFR
jgi:hypothetical protein